MAYSQDRLVAVVLHALLTADQRSLSLDQAVLACERDPSVPADREAVQLALDTLLSDGLAELGDGLFKPTRAAIRAHELSF